ncbi:chaperonin 10-like protein [Crassisporium funariophilum]|nr:chaperonin 10-like protein [Crassisporium funariophilum]
MSSIPSQMRALYYNAPGDFLVKQVNVPVINDDEVLLKGICGTDAHIHELIPGHEAIGTVVKMGKNVKGFEMGDRCVADVGISCETCFYCRRGQSLLCEDFNACGVTQDGGFAEYIKYQQKKLYKIHNLTDEESTLLEPAACAIHGLDKLNPPVGIDVLLMGAGPTGLILAQLLRLNGAKRIVIAANKGVKMDLARKLNIADEYYDMDRENPQAQWQKLKDDNKYGFDVVVEATGVESLANDSINYVRRGGTLMVYGVYSNDALVHWKPSKIFGDEIKIIGSFSQTYCFPRAVEYLDGKKISVEGMVTDTYKLEDYNKALEKMKARTSVKIVIKP